MKTATVLPFTLFAWLLCARFSNICAASSTSTDYGIVADSVDAGGTQASSADYTIPQSVGGIEGIATAVSPAETVKSGYLGQIYQVAGFGLDSSFIANGVTQQLTALRILDDGTTLVYTGVADWNLVGGQLPAGLMLSTSTGVISGNPTGSGSYSFTISVENVGGQSAQQTFTGTVVSKVPFGQWEAQPGFFTTTDPAIIGPAATPENDGITNLLKYVYDINPSVPMSTEDYAAMPISSLAPTGAYLTLTYRQYALATGVTISVQSSPDLKTWTTVATPTYLQQVGIDPNTGDPIMAVEVPTNGPSPLFVRLKVTSP